LLFFEKGFRRLLQNAPAYPCLPVGRGRQASASKGHFTVGP
jgi:hypothetical protein